MSRLSINYFLFSIVFISIFLTGQNIYAITTIEPIVHISPSCHFEDEEKIHMTINGFNKNGNVYWEFINSEGIVDTFGYFSTNSTGGFNDYTIADDFSEDTYTVRFYDDKNNDYIKDAGGVELNSTYSIPCDVNVKVTDDKP
ncbi:MAG: hypothetical protein ACE5SW_10525 [Nitrososphaeraceae archaeon]